jgi:hypothetical protein
MQLRAAIGIDQYLNFFSSRAGLRCCLIEICVLASTELWNSTASWGPMDDWIGLPGVQRYF